MPDLVLGDNSEASVPTVLTGKDIFVGDTVLVVAADTSSGPVDGIKGVGHQGVGVLGASRSSVGVAGMASRIGVAGRTDEQHSFPLPGTFTSAGVIGFASPSPTDISAGVIGAGGAGDVGISIQSGVFGFFNTGTDPAHTADAVFGVTGWCNSTGAGAGVLGIGAAGATVGVEGTGGVGVKGTGTGDGVQGISTSTFAGVKGQSTRGNGVIGISSSLNGVLGICDPDPTVRVGNGISGAGGSYGGEFRGRTAPIRLAPFSDAPTHGPPTSDAHQIGELFADSDGNLFYCGATGTPGKWFRISMTSA